MTTDGKIMELNEAELTMLVSALDKKIWGFDHVGMGDGDPRKIAYKDLKTKVRTNWTGS